MVIPRHGEQSPVEIISYMGYSLPKCTCHDKQSHSSNYMNLLECLHSQTQVPSPQRLPHIYLSRMRVKISSFHEKKIFVLENLLPSFDKKYWTTLRGELLDNSLKQSWSSSEVICWTSLQGNSSENLPPKFLSQTFSFLFHFMSCTHS